VQGIETTATFDPKTDEFVIHSPTLTSTKWWAGDNAKFSNHSIVMAKLIIEGSNYGVMPFLVPIRDEKHAPKEGITLFDLG